MKISQRYPQIMDFYEKRQNNEHFPASNAIDFGKKASKILNNHLYLIKKHIIMQKLDGPLKSLGRNLQFNVC